MTFPTWKINGPLPYEVMYFTRVWGLVFNPANFEGPIPESWAAGMASLDHISFREIVGINGTFPTFFLNGTAYPKLTAVDLTSTSIEGPLPDALPEPATPAPLERIQLSGTRLSGPLTEVFCHLDAAVDVDDTDLEGCIPDCYNRLATQNKFSFAGSRLKWCAPPNPFKKA